MFEIFEGAINDRLIIIPLLILILSTNQKIDRRWFYIKTNIFNKNKTQDEDIGCAIALTR